MRLPNNYLRRRELLHGGKVSAEQLSTMARAYLERECYSEALDFFEKAQNQSGLDEIKKIALNSGDTFLLFRLQRFDSSIVSRSDWEKAAQAAEKREIFSMAAFARNRLAELDGQQNTIPGVAPLEAN